MKLSGGLTEDGVVVGNTYDKYGSRNPVVRLLMHGFHTALFDLVRQVSPRDIHEVGCGEGYLTLDFNQQGIAARGSDFSETAIGLARANAIERGFPPSLFATRSIYALDSAQDTADLIVCCEVLEHLEDPEAGLRALQSVTGRYAVMSVPREPIWRMLNMARGQYWSHLGNTPGHLQNWSRRGITTLVNRFFEVEEVRTPLPWTFLLGRRRG